VVALQPVPPLCQHLSAPKHALVEGAVSQYPARGKVAAGGKLVVLICGPAATAHTASVQMARMGVLVSLCAVMTASMTALDMVTASMVGAIVLLVGLAWIARIRSVYVIAVGHCPWISTNLATVPLLHKSISCRPRFGGMRRHSEGESTCMNCPKTWCATMNGGCGGSGGSLVALDVILSTIAAYTLRRPTSMRTSCMMILLGHSTQSVPGVLSGVLG
jgi:hypothetical protein